MSAPFEVAIAGGGIAGSALAALLAKRGLRVVLLEKDTFPRDKLCGEFLSTEVRAELAQLGAEERVLSAHPRSITSAKFISSSGRALALDLGGTALGLSRRTLDALLFEHAAACGADCRSGVEVTGVSSRAFETSHGPIAAEVIVCAHGRRGRLDKTLDRTFTHQRHPYAAIKQHYRPSSRSDELEGRVELHTFDGGYCGFCFVEDGSINACALIETTRADVRTFHGATASLRDRFASLSPIAGTECAIAEIPFQLKETSRDGALFLGDAAGMIAPLAGDGQAMALSSARILASLIASADRASLCKQWDRAWRSEFARRMLIGRALQAILLRPLPADAAIRALDFVPALSSRLVKMTRG